MPIDPARPIPTTPDGRRDDALAELRRRVEKLERGTAIIQAGTAVPSSSPRDGTAYVRNSGSGILYLRIGGVWRAVNLT